mmetsp:Transcript_67422/g.186863  ORF Transcript_67422/g.186863 Transcript_67422/m.186863 type:complete len:288 (+) Transcript_67422:1360-2223(+)
MGLPAVSPPPLRRLGLQAPGLLLRVLRRRRLRGVAQPVPPCAGRSRGGLLDLPEDHVAVFATSGQEAVDGRVALDASDVACVALVRRIFQNVLRFDRRPAPVGPNVNAAVACQADDESIRPLARPQEAGDLGGLLHSEAPQLLSRREIPQLHYALFGPRVEPSLRLVEGHACKLVVLMRARPLKLQLPAPHVPNADGAEGVAGDHLVEDIVVQRSHDGREVRAAGLDLDTDREHIQGARAHHQRWPILIERHASEPILWLVFRLVSKGLNTFVVAYVPHLYDLINRH